MNEFFDSLQRHEIKVFQIDKTFYEFRNLSSASQIVQYIVDVHRTKIDDNDSIGHPIPSVVNDGVTYYTYVFNETERDSYWASFLPSSISENEDFTIKKLSLILFAVIGEQILAIVGGTGIRVILRYLNHRFGLEFYEYLALPTEDIIDEITTRGISGKLSQNTQTYRDGQILEDSLTFTSIPTRISLILRDDLKDTVFSFIDFNSQKTYLEIASYFCIKIRVSFKELHLVFKKINEILIGNPAHSLTSFVQVKDKALTENDYRYELYRRLREDMFDNLTPSRTENPPKFDIDFVHPSKLQEFYQCDKYELVARGDRNPFFETSDRTKLYMAGLKYLYTFNVFDFNYTLSGIRVYGYKGNVRTTHAMFTQHITCEITVNALPVFYIDGFWYKVQNNFIDRINATSKDMLIKNYLRDNVLTIPWQANVTEGNYNSQYSVLQNFKVLDKIIYQNIELCDLFFEDDTNIYFIHVKTGFDAKIRELGNQIVVSATRFWNDKSSGSYEYIDGIINMYNTYNPLNLINRDDFLKSINTKDISFVMAFKSRNSDLRANMSSMRSNIAKYSLIQCVRDMNTNNYPVKIFDIPIV